MSRFCDENGQNETLSVTTKLDELSIRKISLKMVNQLETNGVGKFHEHKKAMEKHWGISWKKPQAGFFQTFFFCLRRDCMMEIKSFIKNKRKTTSGKIYMKLKSLCCLEDSRLKL
jgi:hypothetical protein